MMRHGFGNSDLQINVMIVSTAENMQSTVLCPPSGVQGTDESDLGELKHYVTCICCPRVDARLGDSEGLVTTLCSGAETTQDL